MNIKRIPEKQMNEIIDAVYEISKRVKKLKETEKEKTNEKGYNKPRI